MDLKKQKPSDRIRVDAPQRSNSEIKGNKIGGMIYDTPEFRRAIEDVSSEFQSRTRTDGKKSRQPMPGSKLRDVMGDFMKRKGISR